MQPVPSRAAGLKKKTAYLYLLGALLSLGSLLSLVSCNEAPFNAPYKPIGDVKQIMNLILDPATDVIWNSAGSITTIEGIQDLAPTTDEQWLAVVHSAAVVAETGNLLMMPGRARDNEDWMEIAGGLVDVGLRAMKAAEDHDADALFDAGGQLYNVCLSCHQQYVIETEGETPALP